LLGQRRTRPTALTRRGAKTSHSAIAANTASAAPPRIYGSALASMVRTNTKG
jgi:hypothetical protein